MARDFSEIARLWVDTYGDDILQLPNERIVEIANQCIDAGLVAKMDPVQLAEGIHLITDVKDALAAAAHARAAADAAMPKLIGTEKQIQWAEEIRKNAIESAYKQCREAKQRQDEYSVSRLTGFIDGVLRKRDHARWFIDNRFGLIEYQIISKRKTARNFKIMSKAEAEARSEISLYPRTPKPFPFQIALLADGSVALCARSDDLASILLKHHMSWDPDLVGWRKIPPEDERTNQAAEIAADLVEKGFVAEVCDHEVRRKAQMIIGFRNV